MSQNPGISVQRIQALYAEIAKSITSSLEITLIVNKIMEKIRLLFKPKNWSLLRLDPETQELYFVVCEGLDSEKIKHLRLKVGEGVAGYVAQKGKPMVVSNVNKSHIFKNTVDKLSGFKTTSIVAVPIKFQGRVLGVIELINAIKKGKFSKRELQILQTIADFSAIALNNAIIHEKMIFLATHDPLTKVYNREVLEKLSHNLTEVKMKANHYNYIIAILIDIDHFKEINDQRGHSVGDHVLIKLADFLIHACRQSDYVFRIGGDEFLIILTNLNSSEIISIENYMEEQFRTFLKERFQDFTFSFGIASGRSTEIQKVIKAADEKMYKLKDYKAEK